MILMMLETVISTYVREFLFEDSQKVKREFLSFLTSAKGLNTNQDLPHNTLTDTTGRPIPFYHGTKKNFTEFSKEAINTSGTSVSTNYMGFFFTTSSDVAKIYASKKFDPKSGLKRGGRINAVFITSDKPYYITEKKYWTLTKSSSVEIMQFIDQLKIDDYDCIIMPSVWRGRGHGSYDIAVFDASQIISINQNEVFSAEDSE